MRYKHKPSESLGITLRARDRRKTATKKEWRSVICRKVKLLLLLLSNTSKIPHLYPLSIQSLSWAYIPDKPSKETRRHRWRTKHQYFRSLLSKPLCLLILSLLPPTNPRELARQGKKRQNSDKGSKYISEQHWSFYKSSSSDIASLLAHHQMLHFFCVKICAALIFRFMDIFPWIRSSFPKF